MPDDEHKLPPDVAAIGRLHRAGWSIGDAVINEGGRPRWLVWGTNGENAIRSEGATSAEAWGNAEHQARSLGMLGSR